MHHLQSYALAQAIREWLRQADTVLPASTSILQGVGNQAGRLVYSCVSGPIVQMANKGNNRAFSSFISCTRERKSPSSLPLLTTQYPLQIIPYLWPQHIQLNPFKWAWESWFINEWTVNMDLLMPCHPGPSFIKFHIYLDSVNRSASKSTQDQQSVVSETDNI